MDAQSDLVFIQPLKRTDDALFPYIPIRVSEFVVKDRSSVNECYSSTT